MEDPDWQKACRQIPPEPDLRKHQNNREQPPGAKSTPEQRARTKSSQPNRENRRNESSPPQGSRGARWGSSVFSTMPEGIDPSRRHPFFGAAAFIARDREREKSTYHLCSVHFFYRLLCIMTLPKALPPAMAFPVAVGLFFLYAIVEEFPDEYHQGMVTRD